MKLNEVQAGIKRAVHHEYTKDNQNINLKIQIDLSPISHMFTRTFQMGKHSVHKSSKHAYQRNNTIFLTKKIIGFSME